MNAVPDITLVIEWENVRLSGEGRELEQVPLAWGIMGSYFGIAVVGALATWIAPGPMSRRFRI